MSKQLNRHTYLIILCISLIFPPAAQAATIAQIGSSDLATEAELIFQGEVTATNSRATANGIIYTYVDFRMDEVLAGKANIGSTLTLRFTGGTVDNTTLDVGATIPEVGERGIYFVESTSQPLINPLLGWAQGHFRISESGVLIAGNNEIVISVEEETRGSALEFSRGVAKGINTLPSQTSDNSSIANGENPLTYARPLSLNEFKKRISAARK